MVVPRSKLLSWVALVVLPFSLLGAVVPAVTALSAVAIGGLVALALVDAWRARARLAGLGLELPLVARMSKDRDAKLEVRIRNPARRPLDLRLALALPRQIQSPQEDARVRLPPDSEWSRLPWLCRPLRRGYFRLAAARLGTDSPLGFWEARQTVPVNCEVRAYPNLMGERRDLAAFFLRRGTVGVHAQRQIGKGREFEKLREYIPGDSFEEIHWKATARRGHPITKVFQIERTQEIYVILDASRLSARPAAPKQEPANSGLPVAGSGPPRPSESEPPTTLERFITAALVLGLAAEQQGDFFGLLTFTDRIERFVRARNGKAHYSACRDALCDLEPRLVTPDYDEVCTFIRLRLRRRALLIFLTALDDPVLAESFVRHLELIRRHHLVLVNMLQPPGVAPLFTNPDVASVDDLYEHLGGHMLWHNLRELEKVLQRRGVRFSLLGNARLSADLVSQYLDVKRRQAL